MGLSTGVSLVRQSVVRARTVVSRVVVVVVRGR